MTVITQRKRERESARDFLIECIPDARNEIIITAHLHARAVAEEYKCFQSERARSRVLREILKKKMQIKYIIKSIYLE